MGKCKDTYSRNGAYEMSEENEAKLYNATKSVNLLKISFEEISESLEILRSNRKSRLPRKLKKELKKKKKVLACFG